MLKPGHAEKLEAFVRNGGTLVVTYFSGMADERDLVTTVGYPGELRSLCGLWVEETDALPPGKGNAFIIDQGPLAGTWKADLLCDIIHPEGAETIARYADDFYAGTPALCRNQYGKGQVWYLGSRPESPLVDRLSALLCKEHSIEPIFPAQEGIEASRRIRGDKEFIFVMNHNTTQSEIVIPFVCQDLLTDTKFIAGASYSLPAAGVLILKKNR